MPSRLRAGKKTGAKVARQGGTRQRRPAPSQRTGPRDPLQEIPGIGPSMAIDLRDLGIRKVSDLKGRDPEQMYQRLMKIRGGHQDRCVLYVFRCAVYYAGTARPKRALLDWWNWKD